MDFLLFLVAGVFGGIALGLIGVGMALITVPLLIFVLPGFGFDPDAVPLVALGTSMAVVSIGSVSSVLSHWRRGNVDTAVARTTIPASLAGVIAGTLAAAQLPGLAVRLLFGVFLVYVALRMLTRNRQTSPTATRPTSRLYYRTAGAAIGLAASVIGAGGGVLMVPFLSSRGHAMPRTVATSTLIGLPVSIVGALIHAARPVALPLALTLGDIYLPAMAGLALGSVIGAPLGARLSGRIPAATLKRGFGAVLIVVAASLALTGR